MSMYDTKCYDAAKLAVELYETHPELGFPGVGFFGVSYVVNTRKALTTTRRALALGTWSKDMSDDAYYRLDSTANGVRVRVAVARDEMCERVVVATEEIPERVIPAHTEEIVEWRCTPEVHA